MESLESDHSWVADGDHRDAGKAVDKFEEDEPRERRYSFPTTPTRVKNLPFSLVFSSQINDIKQANKDFLIDNVYTETKPVLSAFEKRKIKTVSRRTQTYLRELL